MDLKNFLNELKTKKRNLKEESVSPVRIHRVSAEKLGPIPYLFSPIEKMCHTQQGLRADQQTNEVKKTTQYLDQAYFLKT